MSVGTNNPFFDEPYALKRWKRGPLAPYIDGFARRLCDCGYAAAVGQDYIRCIGHLSIWLEQRGLGMSVLDPKQAYCDFFSGPRGADFFGAAGFRQPRMA